MGLARRRPPSRTAALDAEPAIGIGPHQSTAITLSDREAWRERTPTRRSVRVARRRVLGTDRSYWADMAGRLAIAKVTSRSASGVHLNAWLSPRPNTVKAPEGNRSPGGGIHAARGPPSSWPPSDTGVLPGTELCTWRSVSSALAERHLCDGLDMAGVAAQMFEPAAHHRRHPGERPPAGRKPGEVHDSMWGAEGDGDMRGRGELSPAGEGSPFFRWPRRAPCDLWHGGHRAGLQAEFR
jgi:hypothetical protein